MSTEKEKKPDRRIGAAGYKIPEERYAAARVLYESIPGMSYEKVGAEVGISARALQDRSSAEGWVKANHEPPAGMTEAASAIADRYTSKLAEVGPEITVEGKQAVAAALSTEVAIEVRAELLERHRREWGAIRTLVYRQLDPKVAMSDTDRFEKAKLAKISAETLQIIQSNERKAYGLDKAAAGSPQVTVVIERE